MKKRATKKSKAMLGTGIPSSLGFIVIVLSLLSLLTNTLVSLQRSFYNQQEELQALPFLPPPCNTTTSLPKLFVANHTQFLFNHANFHGHQNDPYDVSCQSLVGVISFVDTSYLDVLSVWLHHYKRLDNSNRVLILLGLSETAYQKMKSVFEANENDVLQNIGRSVIVLKADLPTNTTTKQERLSSIWTMRIKMLHKFLTSYPFLNFIFTDLDALWLKDPLPILANPRTNFYANFPKLNPTLTSDIVASKATFPPECSLLGQAQSLHLLPSGTDIHGGTAVFGFIYFRNTPPTRNLAAILSANTVTPSFDDQRELNCYLHNKIQLVSANQFEDGSALLTYQNGGPTRIRLLSHLQVLRHCNPENLRDRENITVIHCLSEKTQEAKTRTFNKFQLSSKKIVKYGWE